MSHIIGRPGDDLLDIMLGDQGADPERAIVGSPEEGDGSEEQPPGDEPADPEQ